MAAVAGQGTTFNLPNYVGELFHLTPSETPFLSMIGGLTGGLRSNTIDIVWQTDDNAAAAQPAVLEGADATFSERDRDQASNVVQIFQEGVELSYTKQAATGNISGVSILGNQPVQDEMTRQRLLKVMKVARDVEFTFIQGTHAKPADNLTARKTRGLVNAITTNTVAGGSAQLTEDMIGDLFQGMYEQGAPFRNLVLLVNAFQKRRFSAIYGYAPESRNVGGVNIMQIETDFGNLGIVLDRHVPTDTVVAAEVSVCAPVILTDGEHPVFSFEPLAKTGSADKEQLYGEIGLHYGPERWHGKIDGLATS